MMLMVVLVPQVGLEAGRMGRWLAHHQENVAMPKISGER